MRFKNRPSQSVVKQVRILVTSLLGGMVLTDRGLREPPGGLKYSVLDLGGGDMGVQT